MILWHDGIAASRLLFMVLAPNLRNWLVFLVVCCFFVMGTGSMALAGTGEDGAGRMTFNILPQSLGGALFAYTQATGAEVFVDDALVVGRRSAPLHGEYDRATALRKLLDGSGLEVRRAANNAFTVVGPSVPEPPLDRPVAWSAERTQFYAAVQTAVRHALCARPDARLGLYRVALAIWVDAAGTVARVRLLNSTVDDETGRALLAAIRNASVGQPPPAGLPQPVTFVILPRAPDLTGDCVPEAAE